MKYCIKTTLEHPISKAFPNCIEEMNVLINNNVDSLLHYCLDFDSKDFVINGDIVERETAVTQNNRPLNKSMDFFIGLADINSNTTQLMFVELKLNYENNLRNLKADDIINKVAHSSNLINGTISIHNNFVFIFSNHIIEQARYKLKRLFPKIPSNYIPVTIDDFKKRYFN